MATIRDHTTEPPDQIITLEWDDLHAPPADATSNRSTAPLRERKLSAGASSFIAELKRLNRAVLDG
jgi:hypothetical protein